MLKLELINLKNIKKLLMLNGILFTKNYNLSTTLVPKLFSLNSPLEIWLLNGSLIEVVSALVEFPLKILTEFNKLLVPWFKLPSTVLLLLTSEHVVNSKKFN